VNLLFEGCKWDIMSHTRPLGWLLVECLF
jgi:hypothetical protein